MRNSELVSKTTEKRQQETQRQKQPGMLSALEAAQEAEEELDMNTVLCKMSHSSKEAVVLATIASQKLLLRSVCSG